MNAGGESSLQPVDPNDPALAEEIRRRLQQLGRPLVTYWTDGAAPAAEKMKELIKLYNRATWTTTRQTHGAVKQLKIRWDQVLRELIAALRLAAKPYEPPLSPAPALEELVADLTRIRREFEAVEWLQDEDILSVTTPPILLEAEPLGRSRIDLRIGYLIFKHDSLLYKVYAADTAWTDKDDSGHPHVVMGTLHAGNYTRPIRRARLAGRIADFFSLILQALQCEDPQRAEVEAAEEPNVHCERCRRRMPEGSWSLCECCRDWCCRDCQDTCYGCGAHACRRCLQKGLCPACRELKTQGE